MYISKTSLILHNYKFIILLFKSKFMNYLRFKMPYILKINIRNLKNSKKNFLNFVQVKFPNIQYVLYEFYKKRGWFRSAKVFEIKFHGQYMYIKKKPVSDLHSIDHLNNCFSRSTISFCGFRKMFKWLMKSSATLSISVQKSRTSFIFNIFLEATERTLYHSEPCLGRRHFRETSDRNVLCFSFYKRTVSFIFFILN